MVREALHAARLLDDPVAIGRALLSYHFCGGPMDLEERLACGNELVELGDRLGVEVFSYVGCQQLWWCYRELGDRDADGPLVRRGGERMRLPDLEQLSYAPSVALWTVTDNLRKQMTDVLSDAWDKTVPRRSTPPCCTSRPKPIAAGYRIPKT